MNRYKLPCVTALHVLNGVTIRQHAEDARQHLILELLARTIPILAEQKALIFNIRSKLRINAKYSKVNGYM
jgi:hypothetical protein